MNKVYLFIIAVILVLAASTTVLIMNNQKKMMSQYENKTTAKTEESGNEQQKAVVAADKTEEITLSVSAPVDGETVTTNLITVRGKTLPSIDVFVNEKQVKSSTAGAFSASLALDEGENPIVVVAADESGNYSEKEMVVNYEPTE